MSVDDRARLDLHRRLEEVLGAHEAETLMAHLPPVTWQDVATKQDLAVLEDRMDAGFQRVDARFGQVDARFEQVDARFEQVDARFEQVDARFEQVDARFGQVDARLGRIDVQLERLEGRFDNLVERVEFVGDRVGDLDERFQARLEGLFLRQGWRLMGMMIALAAVLLAAVGILG